jgi:hypothetical protein
MEQTSARRLSVLLPQLINSSLEHLTIPQQW